MDQLCRFPDNSSRGRRLEKTRTDAKEGISLGSHRRRRGRFCCTEMGFMSFAGRVLFSSIFLLSAYLEFSEFGADGGPAAKALRPKYNRFVKHVSSHLGIVVPHIEMKHILASTIFLKGFGGLLFILSSSLGAYLLLLYLAFITPVVYDFYNYDIEKPEFVQLFNRFAQNVALFGALLFFLSMKNTIARRQSKRVAPKSKTN